MVLEECWNISKNDILVLAYYKSFRDFRIRIRQYFRTKHFKLNMRHYLVEERVRKLMLSGVYTISDRSDNKDYGHRSWLTRIN